MRFCTRTVSILYAGLQIEKMHCFQNRISFQRLITARPTSSAADSTPEELQRSGPPYPVPPIPSPSPAVDSRAATSTRAWRRRVPGAASTSSTVSPWRCCPWWRSRSSRSRYDCCPHCCSPSGGGGGMTRGQGRGGRVGEGSGGYVNIDGRV